MSVNPAMPAVTADSPAASGSTPAPAPTPSSPLYSKYGGDWGKANEGYFNAVNKLTEVSRAAEAISQRNQQLESALANFINGGQPNVDDPLAPIQDQLGLPIEPLRKGIRGEARGEALKAVEEFLKPVMERFIAEEGLAAEIENFDSLKGQARNYMRSAPDVKETFDALLSANKPSAAWKYAIQQSLIASGGKPAGGTPSTPGLGLPGGHAAGGGRSEPNPGGVTDQVRYEEAAKYAREFGDNGPMVHERLKGTSVDRAVRAAMVHLGLQVPDGT